MWSFTIHIVRCSSNRQPL